MPLTPEIIEAVRQAYAEGELSLGKIAELHGVDLREIHELKRRDNWPARRPVKAAMPPAKPRQPPAAVHKRKLIKRLYRAIDRKLEQMEVSMTSEEPVTAADSERETRALGNLVKNFEKVRSLETDLERDAGAAPAKPDAGPGAITADDAERKRRLLAERIRKVRERVEGGVAGGS